MVSFCSSVSDGSGSLLAADCTGSLTVFLGTVAIPAMFGIANESMTKLCRMRKPKRRMRMEIRTENVE
jgi:hypothetical protein